jgi:hypothetical protein
MMRDREANLLAAGIASVVFFVTASAASSDLEYLLDLDDYENFVTHPLVTYVAAMPRRALSFSAAWPLLWRPVLGVVEPVTALLRSVLAAASPTPLAGAGGARATYLVGCALHASNAAQLALLLAEVGAAGLLFGAPRAAVAAAAAAAGATTGAVAGDVAAAAAPPPPLPLPPVVVGPSRRAVAAATLAWALHPLRGEALGWLSCQAYLFATAFALAAVRASVASLHGSSSGGGSRGRGHWRGLVWFVLACGCKAVRWGGLPSLAQWQPGP